MRELTRGQKVKLADLTPSLNLVVGLDIAAAGSPVFDISCFGVDAADRLSDDRYFIFYNQKTSPENALVMLGPQPPDREAFQIDLSRLPQTIRKLVFTITIDGVGTMAQVSRGHLRLLAGGAEVARFTFTGGDFSQEKAIIAGELYYKDMWRFAAVGQGFNGGLSALLKHFGGEEVQEAAAPAPPPPPAQPSAPTVNLKKVELEKKMEQAAPQLLSLAKKAQVSLEKVNLGAHQAKVALCLDISASMSTLYKSGKIQRFAEKVLALGTRFDDDGSIDIFLFGSGAHQAGEMTIANFSGFIAQIQRQYPLEGGTNYGKAIRMIRQFYFPDAQGGPRQSPVRSPIPVYVMFLTDGQTMDRDQTRQQLIWGSYEPIFWQFMGIGQSNKDVKKKGGSLMARLLSTDFSFLEELDNLTGRYVDNANFFSVEDPEIMSDEQLYDLLMAEYPGWVKQAPAKGLLP
ncbi:MAG TPA: VWA domain-containing protein [Blastocatellia bacterium]|nr:VWA domain-containing protein [Blastocatellia bacterium]